VAASCGVRAGDRQAVHIINMNNRWKMVLAFFIRESKDVLDAVNILHCIIHFFSCFPNG